MTHKIQLSEPAEFIGALKVVGALIDEALFRFDKDGIKIVAMDAANISMVIFSYSSTFEGEGQYGVNLKNLNTILQRAGKSLTMEFGEEIHIQTAKDNISKEFVLPIIADIEDKSEKIPGLKFTATIKVKSEQVISSLKDVEIMGGESCVFSVENNKFGIAAQDELKTVDVDLVPESIESEGNVRCKYSIDYLKRIISKLAEYIKISFARDYPLKLDYSAENMHLTFILAPRVENETTNE